MKIKEDQEDILESSGNIYADLGYTNPEEMKTKAKLAMGICLIIRKKKLTQEEAAKKLGLTQPKISNLVNGKLSGFSVERLMNFLNMLDCNIEITLKKKHKSQKKARTYVFNERQTSSSIAAKTR